MRLQALSRCRTSKLPAWSRSCLRCRRSQSAPRFSLVSVGLFGFLWSTSRWCLRFNSALRSRHSKSWFGFQLRCLQCRIGWSQLKLNGSFLKCQRHLWGKLSWTFADLPLAPLLFRSRTKSASKHWFWIKAYFYSFSRLSLRMDGELRGALANTYWKVSRFVNRRLLLKLSMIAIF